MIDRFRTFFSGGERLREARHTIKKLGERQKEHGYIRSREALHLLEARRITRRHALKLIGAGTGAAALLGGSGSLVFQSIQKADSVALKQEPRPQNPSASQDSLLKAIAWQDAQKKRVFKALDIFKNSSAKTQELFKMLESHALYSLPVGPVATRVIFPKRASLDGGEENPLTSDPLQFEVVFMPEEYAAAMSSSLKWDADTRTLRIAARISSDEWLAVFLNHELSHVYDFLFGGEDPNNRQEWIEGEVRAFVLECELMEKWKADAYDRLIAQGLPLWRERNIKALMRLGEQLFPQPSSSEHARGLADAAFITCVAFEDARREKKDLVAAYLELEKI